MFYDFTQLEQIWILTTSQMYEAAEQLESFLTQSKVLDIFQSIIQFCFFSCILEQDGGPIQLNSQAVAVV